MTIDDRFTLTLKNDPATAGVLRIDEFTGAWAMERNRFEAMAQHISTVDLAARVAEFAPESLAAGYELTNGVAVIEIRGTMTKGGSSMSDAGSTIRVRRSLRQAANDAEVRSILLLIESPGGTSAGTKELADEIASTNMKKPVTAYIEDIGASAAYWAASQAGKVYANASAVVGSIGVYMAVADYSELAAKEGIKVHVIRAGAFKGAGLAGTEVTDEQLAEWQRLVNQVNEFFTADVSRARSFSKEQMATLADGRVHIADDAITNGLIDGVRTLDDVLADLVSSADENQNRRSSMSDPTPTDVPKVATLSELETGFPTATSEWTLSQLKASATLEQARAAWQTQLEDQLAAANTATETAEARAQKAENAIAKSPAPGNTSVGGAPAADGDTVVSHATAITKFRSEVAEKADKLLAATPTMRPMEARRRAMTAWRANNVELAAILDEGIKNEE